MKIKSLASKLKKNIFNIIEKNYYCPVCNEKIKHFMPLPQIYEEKAKQYGYKYFGQGETINIKNYSCPICGASDRERLYALYLNKLHEDFLSSRKIHRLLHFSPEISLSKKLAALPYIQRVTADLMMDGVDDKIDITSMDKYPNNHFDCFICSHVLEHVNEDKQALQELYRVLKPNGWGIIMVPIITNIEKTIEDSFATSEEDRWRLFGQSDHVRLYAKKDFLNRIRGVGFQVNELNSNYFGSKIFTRCGITQTSTLYIARK